MHKSGLIWQRDASYVTTYWEVTALWHFLWTDHIWELKGDKKDKKDKKERIQQSCFLLNRQIEDVKRKNKTGQEL